MLHYIERIYNPPRLNKNQSRRCVYKKYIFIYNPPRLNKNNSTQDLVNGKLTIYNPPRLNKNLATGKNSLKADLFTILQG